MPNTITPCLWFDNQAEAAAEFYTKTVKDSRITHVARYPETVAETAGQSAGSVMTVEFDLKGQSFVGMNGGPMFQFTPAISLMLYGDGQDEVDELWNAMAVDGQQQQCGWLQDQFGISWQIIPREFDQLIKASDPAAVARIMAAVMTMTKIEMEPIRRAAKG